MQQETKHSKGKPVVIALIIVALLLGVGAWYGYRRYQRTHERHAITVFIHGTFFSSLSAVSIKSVLQDELDESSWYVQMAKTVRKETMLLQDQVIGDEGLFEVSPEKVKGCHNCDLPEEDKKFGAAFIVDAYDRIVRAVGRYGDYNHYYAFGWSGLLSHKKRLEASQLLYDQLCDLIEQYKQHYGATPEITLVAHSHGGNVAKLLAQVEKDRNCHLKIKYLVMYGTPIQSETASMIESDIIGTCISCYSDGDSVQGSDMFSSKDRSSKKKLSDLVNMSALNAPNKRRCDVRLIFNNDPSRIGHMNMWYMGRAQKVFSCLDPLPLMVLTPLIIQEVEQAQDLADIDLHFTEARGVLTAHVCEHSSHDILCWSDNLYHACVPAALYARINWNPGDKSRNLMFNYRNYAAIKKAWFGE